MSIFAAREQMKTVLASRISQLIDKCSDVQFNQVVSDYIESENFSKVCASFKYNNPVVLVDKPTMYSFSRIKTYVYRKKFTLPDDIKTTIAWNDFVQFDLSRDLELFEDFAEFLENKTNLPITKMQKKATKKKEESQLKKAKKVSIPATLKRLVWNKHVGEDIGKAKCLCCRVTDITQLSFNCGHIVSERNGGQLTLDNLLPICQNCNSSMGTMDMNEFKDRYKI